MNSILGRLRPPSEPFGETERWVLAAAFGPLGMTRPRVGPAGAALAARLGVAARIGDRLPEPFRSAECGHDGAQRLREATREAAASAMVVDATLDALIGTAAQPPTIPFAILKGAALHESQIVRSGARPVSDLDVLVPGEQLALLVGRLQRERWIRAEVPGNRQHAPPMRAPSGGKLDLHFRLGGLRFPKQGESGLAELRERSLLAPVGRAAHVWLPTRSLLAAHAIAHGLSHLGRPRTYPLLRMIADLIDILPEKGDWDRMIEESGEALSGTLPASELVTLRRLCRGLRDGLDPEAGGPSPGLALLRHIFVVEADPGYAARLEGRTLRRNVVTAAREGRLLRYILPKLLPPRGRIEADPEFPNHRFAGGSRRWKGLLRRLFGAQESDRNSR